MLIRPQAIAEARYRSYGRAVVRVSLPHAVAAVTLGALFTLLVYFLCTTTYTERTQVPGYLVPEGGIVRLRAPRRGLVDGVFAAQGDVVRRGDLLARVISDHWLEDGVSHAALRSEHIARRARELAAQRALTERRRQTDAERLNRERADLARQLEIVDGQLEAQARGLALARERHDRHRAAVARGAVPAAELLRLEHEIVTGELQQKSLERNRASLAAEIGTLALRAREQAEESESRRSSLALAELDLESLSLDNASARSDLIVSPIDGRIVSLATRTGAEVDAGRELLVLAPVDGDLRAELFLPAETIGLVPAAARVTIRYDAFPYAEFGVHEGTVREIAAFVIDRRDIELELPVRGSVYRVVVDLARQSVSAREREVSLAAGMTLRADVALRELSLVDWLFEPLLALRAAPFRR